MLDDDAVCSETTWKLPSLRSLDWRRYWTTINNYTDCEFSVLDPLWRQELPALRDLTLRGSFFSGDIGRPDVHAFIRRLTRLCMSASALPPLRLTRSCNAGAPERVRR
jgi:hypothetical protein